MAGQIFRCDFARQATRRAGILQAHHTRSSACHSPDQSHSDETHHTTHTRPSILTLRFRVSQGTSRLPWLVQHASASLSEHLLHLWIPNPRLARLGGSDRKKRIPLPTQGNLLPLGASMTGVRDSTHPRMWICTVECAIACGPKLVGISSDSPGQAPELRVVTASNLPIDPMQQQLTNQAANALWSLLKWWSLWEQGPLLSVQRQSPRYIPK